jgi:SAM-dependent methyltransferase
MVSDTGYDEIADWYEEEFLGRRQFDAGIQRLDRDPLGIDRSLSELLGPGTGICLEVGCGTGGNAARVRALGWHPVGVDLSAGMLRYSRGRLPALRADAEQLPIGDATIPAVVAVMVHTDMPEYPKVVCEAARVLVPGGVFVHVGVHPCFCGSFADRSNHEAVLIRPGYLDRHWATSSWTNDGIRSRVGATHRPLPEVANALLDAGLTLGRFVEGGQPTPVVLAVSGRKPQ